MFFSDVKSCNKKKGITNCKDIKFTPLFIHIEDQPQILDCTNFANNIPLPNENRHIFLHKHQNRSIGSYQITNNQRSYSNVLVTVFFFCVIIVVVLIIITITMVSIIYKPY